MQTLYHHPLCPLSRQIRVFLKELQVDFIALREDFWLRRKEFLQKNPAGTVPVLEIENKVIIVGYYSIIEYMNDSYDNFFFMPKDKIAKANVRQYISWFNDKFFREVSKILIDEKMIRLFTRNGVPNTDFIRVAKTNLLQHLKFLTEKLEHIGFIVSDKISCADIAAASHISILDYLGEINWDEWELIKQWYSIIKSRPSFQSILADRIPGFSPPVHYTNLDF